MIAVAPARRPAESRSKIRTPEGNSMGPKETRVRRPVAGFTLLELLVVVLIIGLLAGFVAPRYFNQVGKSEISVAKAQIDALEKALDQYRLDTGPYPFTRLRHPGPGHRPGRRTKR